MQVLHPRAVRRNLPGGHDLADHMRGTRFDDVSRRGKCLWLDVADAGEEVAVVVHLRMSGQRLLAEAGAPNPVIPRADVHDLLEQTRSVMSKALTVGGISFDALYVESTVSRGTSVVR